MAINAVNTTGAPNELYRAVDIAGGAVGDYDFKLASTLDGGIIDVRLFGYTVSRKYVRDVWLTSDVLKSGTVHQDTGTVGLICSITALGSGNKIRISITNNEPSLGFNGKMHVRFYMNGVVVDG